MRIELRLGGPPVWLTIVAAMTFALGTTPVRAEQSDEKKDKGKVKSELLETDEPGEDGQVVVHGRQAYVDQGGKVRRATPEEAQALAVEVTTLVNDSPEGLRARSLPDGTQVIDLEGRFLNVSLATLNEDGTLSLGCVRNAQEAEDFLKGMAEPAAKGAKKEALDEK